MKYLSWITSSWVAILLGGCAVSADGDKIASGKAVAGADSPRPAIESVKTRPAQPAGKAEKSKTSKEEEGKETADHQVTKAAPGEEFRPDAKTRLIIIGNTLALHAGDKATSHKRYDAYEASLTAAKFPVLMERDWFVAHSAGYAAIKYWGVSGVMSRWMYAEVPKEMKERIEFPSEMMSSVLGISTDLVAAEQKEKGGIWITRVLCAKKQRDFEECSKKYAKGLFRESDGKEIDASWELVENGAQIDLRTFQKRDRSD
jgi:hypothetical protein